MVQVMVRTFIENPKSWNICCRSCLRNMSAGYRKHEKWERNRFVRRDARWFIAEGLADADYSPDNSYDEAMRVYQERYGDEPFGTFPDDGDALVIADTWYLDDWWNQEQMPTNDDEPDYGDTWGDPACLDWDRILTHQEAA